MKFCLRCDKHHENSGKFCSRSCANSRTWSKEQNQNRSVKASLFWNSLSPEEQAIRNTRLKSVYHLESVRRASLKTMDDWDTVSYDTKRRLVIENQKNACANCHIDNWMGHNLVLEIDHKDGDRNNNSRENLEAICPNCHSITPTWRGRSKRKQVSDEQLIEALSTSVSIRSALVSLGLAGKGDNYKRAKRLLNQIVKKNIDPTNIS